MTAVYLLDTNVVSEAASKSPESKVVAWCEQHSLTSCISAVTLGEIWKGIHLMPECKRKSRLERWAIRLEVEVSEPPLALDADVFRVWGALYARNQSIGFNMGILDSLLAATALHHGLTVATRNTSDFPPEVGTFNPWIT